MVVRPLAARLLGSLTVLSATLPRAYSWAAERILVRTSDAEPAKRQRVKSLVRITNFPSFKSARRQNVQLY